MSTATRALLLLAVACVSDPNTRSGWLESNARVRSFCKTECDKGDLDKCYCEARDLLAYPTNSQHKDWEDHSYQLDRAKAQGLLERACNAPNMSRASACIRLVQEKMIAFDDVLAHCTDNPALCDAAPQYPDLSETQWYTLVKDHPNQLGCTMAGLQIHDDAKYGEVLAICGVDAVEREVVSKLPSDDDDDAPSASDSACHKDTDCKGDRICQAGNCVDPKAGAAKPAPPAQGPFKQPACDAFAKLVEERISKCSTVMPAVLTNARDDMDRGFKKLPKERYDAVGARCSAATSKLEPLLGKLHC